MKTPKDHTGVDEQIASLLTCKPLPEAEIKALCEKVHLSSFRLKKFSQKNPMLFLSEHLSLSAETSMDSSTTLWNSLKSEERFPSPITSSWETMSTEVFYPSCRTSLSWNSYSSHRTQSEIQRQNHHSKRKSRIQTNHSGLRLLWLMLPQIWKFKCLEMPHWTLWLPSFDCRCWKSILLPSRRTLTQHLESWQHQSSQKNSRSSTWRTHVRFAMVRSWW